MLVKRYVDEVRFEVFLMLVKRYVDEVCSVTCLFYGTLNYLGIF